MKYGFVYLWVDKKYNRFYVGSHWGTEDDRYICSSASMREAYRRRKEDFKRYIIKKIFSNRKALLEAEQYYIDLIPKEEFGRSYYNINSKVYKYSWWMNEESKKQVGEKISSVISNQWKEGKYNNSYKRSAETCKRMSIARIGKEPWNKGIPCSEEQKKNHSIKMKGKPTWNKGKKNCYTQETIENMSKSNIGKEPWNKGKKSSKPAWNKGLTKENDARVADYAIKMSHPKLKKQGNYKYKI